MRHILILLALILPGPVGAAEPPKAPRESLSCPAPKLLPQLDDTYHECRNGFANGSCERFVRTFRELLSKYDCSRSFDGNVTVPAIWLANNAAFEDYIKLLSQLSARKGRMFKETYFKTATDEALQLFASEAFRDILDGHMAEEYWGLSKAAERKSKKSQGGAQQSDPAVLRNTSRPQPR